MSTILFVIDGIADTRYLGTGKLADGRTRGERPRVTTQACDEFICKNLVKAGSSPPY